MIYEAEVSYMMPDGGWYTTEAFDKEDAEYKIMAMVKEDKPEATMIVIDEIKEVIR